MATKKPADVPPIPEPVAPVEAAPALVTPPEVAPTAAPTYEAPVYAAPPTYAPQPAGPPQGLSIASLVCGIAGLVATTFGFGFLPALAAVITGHIAQRSQPHAKPFWLTGLITGYVGLAINIVIGVFLVIALIALLFGASMYFDPRMR